MSMAVYKRLTLVLTLACAALCILCVSAYWKHGWLRIRVEWAGEQTKIFDAMRSRALSSDVAEAVNCLTYVTGYYPSGTKQPAGSQLDRMVERERAFAVRDIITHLRNKTGDNLGESPEAWIKKYARP